MLVVTNKLINFIFGRTEDQLSGKKSNKHQLERTVNLNLVFKSCNRFLVLFAAELIPSVISPALYDMIDFLRERYSSINDFFHISYVFAEIIKTKVSNWQKVATVQCFCKDLSQLSKIKLADQMCCVMTSRFSINPVCFQRWQGDAGWGIFVLL